MDITSAYEIFYFMKSHFLSPDENAEFIKGLNLRKNTLTTSL